ncbi:MAG: hypothetical protein HQ574_01275 [Chloroflexi bacterium]|nr:hypothetical protein [Chloroflexota bacterium]
MVLKQKYFLAVLLILTLTACAVDRSILQIPLQEDKGPHSTVIPAPEPKRILSICLGEEPDSLFIYGDQSTSANIIRQAIYDGPVDQVNFQPISTILEDIPSRENELVNLSQIEVYPGDQIIDARSNLTILGNGVVFSPSGCDSEDCWESFENQPSIFLDQVEIIYPVRSGIIWSDGTPLKASDSIFSHRIASLIYGSGGPGKLRYTSNYELMESGEISWKGLPGYRGLYSYTDFFFSPLPEHLWQYLGREELLTSYQSVQRPIGWGAYTIQEWIPGDHLTLVANDTYHLTPSYFDSLVFRFVEGGVEALAAYMAGECQIVANVSDLNEYQSDLKSLEREGQLNIQYVEGKAWEQLSFGISSRDGKLTLLGNPILRQAMAGCIDRERIAGSRLDAGSIVDDFFLPGFPLVEEIESDYSYLPIESGLILKDLGWTDHDGDPATPRISEGVEGIPDGRVLLFTLLAAETASPSTTVEIIQESLGSCGIGVDIQYLPASELLAPGPEGPVFGRDFDLAYFAWAAGSYQPCRLFLSDEIPGLYPEYPKGWGGVNAPGYSNQNFDLACRAVFTNLPDSVENLNALADIQSIFREELPALPLFFRKDLIIVHPDLTGIESGIFPLFWNVEAFEKK